MSETKGQIGIAATYQAAQPVASQVPPPAQTSSEDRSVRTTLVAGNGQTVRMRIIPRPPRQSGEAAKTG